MKLRTALAGAALAGGLLLAPNAAHAAGGEPNPDGGNVAVVTVVFEHHCDHTVTITVANITNKTATFQINERAEQTVDPMALSTSGHVPTFSNERGEDVVRVRLLNGTRLDGGTGAGTSRVVEGWTKPAGCNQPAAATQTETKTTPAGKVTYSDGTVPVNNPRTTTHPPVTVAGVDSLPVTGPGAWRLAAGAFLLVLGAGLVLGARRRRVQVKA